MADADADADAAFVQKILHIPQRERKPHVHHNGQADDLWARLKVPKGGTFCHPATLISRPARLKQVSSDSARGLVDALYTIIQEDVF